MTLRELLAHRRLRMALVIVMGMIVTACVTIACVLQFWLFPRINDYRSDLAQEVGAALGVKVSVGNLYGAWSTAHPRFVLDDVVVFDARQRPAVTLTRIEATLSWWEMLTGNLGFRSLAIAAPTLDFRRDSDGKLFLAGLPLGGGGDFRVDALLEQGTLQLATDRLTWRDGKRSAPELVLQDVRVRMRSGNARHRLEVAFTPPVALGSPFKGRAKWLGERFKDWQDWELEIALQMQDVDLAGWKPWVDYPIPVKQGRAALDVTLEATGLNLAKADGVVTLSDINVQLADRLEPLILEKARSEFDYVKRSGGQTIKLALKGFTFTDATGKQEPPANIAIQRLSPDGASGLNSRVLFKSSRLDLARIYQLSTRLPLPEDTQKRLARMKPAGILENLSAEFTLTDGQAKAYEGRAEFTGLSLQSEDGQRFVRGLSGKVVLDQNQGKLTLDSSGMVLAMPGVLPINEVPLSALTGQIGWELQKDKSDAADRLSVSIKSLRMLNDDLDASVNGSWSGLISSEASERDRAGLIDMKIDFAKAKTESGWKYVPLSASADISTWMKGAIRDGSISDFHIDMEGAVWDMPFGSPVPGSAPGASEATGAAGTFVLGFKTKDVTVQYGDGYPPLKKLDAIFVMNQNRINITASDGWINEMRFSAIKAEMPDVSAYENHLLISGQATGPTESAVLFLQKTPVADHIHHFAEGMAASGNGKLDLTLDLNLLTPAETKISGSYEFKDNRVTILAGAPPVSMLNGSLRFTDHSLDSSGLQGQWSGQPLTVRLATDAAGTKIEASGRASAAELRQHYGWPLFEQISGQTNWDAHVTLRAGKADLILRSDLKGLTSSLPEPFNKSAATALPLTLTRQTAAGALRRPEAAVDQVWRVALGNALAGTFSQNGRGQVVRGRLVLGSGSLPSAGEHGEPGIHLESLRPFNLDYWMKAFGMGAGAQGGNRTAKSVDLKVPIVLKAPSVTAFGQKLQDFRLTARPMAERLSVQVSSKELQGDVEWYAPGTEPGGQQGLLKGHLSRLDLTAAADSAGSSAKGDGARSEIESLPDLAFRVDDLQWQGQPWGKLNFRARNQKTGDAHSWRIDPFQLDGPDLRFSGRLNWVMRNQGSGRGSARENMTALDFKMQSPQVGNLLTKLGFPGTVKRGTAQMEGQVSWPANPFAFDPGKLSGNFKMSAKNGQFVKMDPGAGRLLGLLSLQSLPQRLSLDFRDIFSEGLAFEAIEGRFDIRDGLMKTSDLEMDTPAARVLMRGETNLAAQTQDVRVIVRPALSNSVALGVTVLNPIAGAATFLTQKVLGDPLSRLFSYQYHITGTWSDPEVDKESLPSNVMKAGQDIMTIPVDAVEKAGKGLSGLISDDPDAQPATLAPAPQPAGGNP